MFSLSKKYLSITLVPFLISALVFKNTNANDDPKYKGWATLSGNLSFIEMEGSDSIEWKELGLIDEEGNITILIGELVTQLYDKIDRYVTLTGVYKPPMLVKGKPTPVLEIKFIDEVKDETQK
ncbi:MAG: hypothetical protein NC908_04185 [Candidatus Omnitrophica bacterium]|nr:hypothetical protein [Candidatus Omnitrophota bacterium]